MVLTRTRIQRLIFTSLFVFASSSCGSYGAAVADEPHTLTYLLHLADVFNTDYAKNRDTFVYQQWDPGSQRVISEQSYVHRHEMCQSAPGIAVVEGAHAIANGFWAVHYEISGTQLVDYWRYLHGRWRFDLLRSNPSAVRLYKLPFVQYARQLGCA